MAGGLIGLCGLNALSPVVKELVNEAESVTARHHNMVEMTVTVAAVKVSSAIHNLVLVSLLARQKLLVRSSLVRIHFINPMQKKEV